MNQTIAKGIPFSTLSLGTVQLGMNYGINNTNGKPDLSTSFSILNTALEHGITALDTSDDYGDSEDVIGEWLKTVPKEKHPFITTKVGHLDHSSLDALRSCLYEHAETSKRRLGISQIPLLMLHSYDEYALNPDNLHTVFDEMKADGTIRFSGISAYAHHDYGKIAASGFDAVQIPANIFDWRQIDNGGIEKLHKAGMLFFVRSVFLQGLVFHTPDTLPAHMKFCEGTIRKFRALCDKYQMEPAVLALSYARSIPGVTSLVLGSETPEQVKQNVAVIENTIQLTPEQMEEIHEAFKNTDDKMLNPSRWNEA